MISCFFLLALILGNTYHWRLSTSILVTFVVLCLGQILGSPLLLFVILAVSAVLVMFRWRFISVSLHLGEYPLLLLFGFMFSLLSISGMQEATCFIDKSIYSADVHLDTLFNAGIASMLSIFSIPSTGLHGLPLIKYHVLSHSVYGSTAKWLAMPVLQVYGFATFVVFIPLLFCSILFLAEKIAPSRNLKSFYLRIAMTFLIYTGFFGFSPNSLFSQYALWDSYLVSESYLISLILLLAFLSALISKRHKHYALEWAIWLLLLALAKVSVGALAFLILSANILLMNHKSWLWKARLIAIMFTISCALGLFISGSTGRLRLDLALQPTFIKVYAHQLLHGPMGKILTDFVFLTIHFFYVWFALIMMSLSFKTGSMQYRFHKKMLLFLIIATTYGGTALFIKGLDSGIYYFTNISMFLAVPLIVSGANNIFDVTRFRLKRNYASLVYICLFCSGLIGFLFKGIPYFKTRLDQLSTIRMNINTESVYAPYVRYLEEIRDDKTTREYLVYLAKDQTDYWKEIDPSSSRKMAFMIPAISQRPAIYGLPVSAGILYGFACYDKETFKTGSASRLSEEQLKQEAKRLGYRGYIDVEAMGWRKLKVNE
jgi:hypothetical protein